MSNCIKIVENSSVIFSNEMIDRNALTELLIKTEEEINKDNCVDPGVDGDLRIAWWFLSSNVEFQDDCIIVFFGDGRSTHTWRDFNATINLINKFVKNDFSHSMYVSDESDGFETIVPLLIKFGKEAVNNF